MSVTRYRFTAIYGLAVIFRCTSTLTSFHLLILRQGGWFYFRHLRKLGYVYNSRLTVLLIF